ncbi:MAG TPA: nuclease [Verrucomicrobiae bacterium]|nr:nuclease [Verrucomicrobiae bacterium]
MNATGKTLSRAFASPSWIVVAIMMLLIGEVPAFGWGNRGHTDINFVAASKIPKSMPLFFRTRAAVARIAYLGPEPDRWRGASEYALNNSQSPDHFIDLERVEGLGALPKGRYEFYKMLYAKRAATQVHPDDYLPENVGLQPYITMEVFERLKVAFRDYRSLKQAGKDTGAVEQDAIFYAGWLGHYVADGSQPLHTTIDYDGWVGANPDGFTTQRGIHWRFENDFVNRTITAKDFAAMAGAPHQLDDVFNDYLKYLWVSHGFVKQIYEFDKSGSLNGSGTPEAVKFTEQRLAAGSQMLLDLWYTAWLESAEPAPGGANPVPAK